VPLLHRNRRESGVLLRGRNSQETPAPGAQQWTSVKCGLAGVATATATATVTVMANKTAATKKGATTAEREERGLLPAHIREDAPLFYVGKCPCCGDRYLSNKHAKQCAKTGNHESKGFGLKFLTLDRGSVSDIGECTEWKKKQ
jgi:hypothetical protein